MKLRVIFGLMLIACILVSCGYSFTGASLDPSIESIKISQFPNYAPLQNPNLSQQFTNDLQDRFDQRTKLILTDDNDAHIKLEGEIVGYDLTPVNVVSGEQAAQNRLTIMVKVRYENTKDDEKSFNKTFSDYEDFPATQTLQQAEESLVDAINGRLIDQIFNAVVADW